MNGETDIRQLKGIGVKTSGLFAALHIQCVEDLLEYFPREYDTMGAVCKVSGLQPEGIAAVRVQVTGQPKIVKVRSLTILRVSAADETGSIGITFFNMPFLKNVLKSGSVYVVRGLFRQENGQLTAQHPKLYRESEYLEIAGSIQPKYGLTAGLSNNMIIKAQKQALCCEAAMEEYMPEQVLEQYGLAGRKEALWGIHFPQSQEQLQEARKRLVFDEFLLFLLQLRRMKMTAQLYKNHAKMIETADTGRLIELLPYQLTGAQKRVWQDIVQDLSGEYRMNRLVQGDVGSGKTVLAILALLMCAANGYQGALMAPTEVLARQHYEQAVEMTEQYGLCFRPVLLTGSTTQAARREIYERIACGEANLIIGTHALIQEKVIYCKLGLVVTDEQHRFGVRQREALAGKGEDVHALVMSATPIPRTLGIILYGDLNLSAVDELPADRLPIKNCVVGQNYRKTAYRFLEQETAKGRQAYVICPMVEEGELENVENVTDYTHKLRAELPDKITVACLHGRMKPAQKNQIMEEFAAGNIDILVSTTVIEVGINVPNATVMMIENAERFGLAQLHQLRGRVGRGKEQSYCIFISGSGQDGAMERLQVLKRSNDGFEIAQEDLKLRGPGELFGIRQSGALAFRIGDIFGDAKLLQEASECAQLLFDKMEDRPQDYAALIKRLQANTRNAVDFQSL